mgnify:CR=1 FL=1
MQNLDYLVINAFSAIFGSWVCYPIYESEWETRYESFPKPENHVQSWARVPLKVLFTNIEYDYLCIPQQPSTKWQLLSAGWESRHERVRGTVSM